MRRYLALLLLCLLPVSAPGADPEPRTVAEKSGYKATSRSAEVEHFIDQIVHGADHMRRIDFGKTVEGRPMVAAVVARPMVSDPAALKKDPRAVVLLLGNIHSGECAGKEALLMLLRELKDHPDRAWLKNLVLVFVPNYNADGNDKVGKNNRRGQIGPEQGMGRRANARNLDLNRDYMKIDSPECRALIRLMSQWDPHLFIDTHTTNGSQHRYALTYDIPHNPASPRSVREYMRQEMMPVITRNLEQKDIATVYYGNFNREHTRWTTFGDYPRFGTEYVGLRGRMSILSEAYAYITYRERIMATRAFVRECLTYTAAHTRPIRELLQAARQQAVAAGNHPRAGDMIPIESKATAMKDKIVVKGFKLPPGGARRGEKLAEPQDHTVEFIAHYVPILEVPRPFAYLIPKGESDVVERLRTHGAHVEPLAEDATLTVETYRVTSIKRSERAYQGHHMARATVEKETSRRRIPAGTLLVRTGQPLGNLICYLLEPASNDGFVTWNFFDPELAHDAEYPVLRVPAPVELETGHKSP